MSSGGVTLLPSSLHPERDIAITAAIPISAAGHCLTRVITHLHSLPGPAEPEENPPAGRLSRDKKSAQGREPGDPPMLDTTAGS